MNNTKNLTLNSQLDYWNGQKKTISRNGLGMNPSRETGTTDALQSGTFRNPINAPPQHLEDTCNYALDNIVQLYAERYQRVWQRRQTQKTTRIQRWTNNSSVNARPEANSVAFAISTPNVKSYGSASVPLSVSVQVISIPLPSTNFTYLAV